MPGNPMVIGPFIRGLNNTSTAGESEDTEVVELINMEVSLDKSLESRPPFIVKTDSLTSQTENHRHKVYGTYFISENEWYLIILWPTGGHARLRACLRGDLTDFVDIKTFSSILNTEIPTDMVQFKDSLFFSMPAGSSTDGFSWDKINGVVHIPTMPKCQVLISWKNRLWAAGSPASSSDGDRIWFSSVDKDGLHPNKWEAINFFDTAPGEGGYITAMVPHFNNLIIFKNDGTWRFSYSAQPAQGLVEKISGSVGTFSKDSVVEFENMVYCYDQGVIYELVNSSFNPINIKLKFNPDPGSSFVETPDVTLSVLNRRLVVRYRNAIYVYSAETRTWGQWRSSRGLPYKFYELPGDSASSESSTYIAAQNSPAYRTTIINSDDIIPIKSNVSDSGNLTYSKGRLNLTGFTESATIILNGANSISCSPAQQISLELNVETNTFSSVTVQLRRFDATGATAYTSEQAIVPGSNKLVFPTSNNTALFDVLMKISPTDVESTLSGSGMTLAKEAGNTPSYLFTLKHKYENTAVAQENIECSVTTKVYDFGIPSVFKRLFLWGVDIRTVSSVAATTLLTRRAKPLTFGDIDLVDNTILSEGTWGAPIAYDRDNKIIDITDPIIEQTDNNRFFIKLLKGIRFRQIAFNIKTVTDGTSNTGPVKLYTLTAYVSPKQMTVDKIS